MPHENWEKRKLEGAERYAAADRSDPFAFQRAMTHIKNRIVGYTQDGSDSLYNAEPATEMRKHPRTGEEYPVTIYRNMKRP